MLYKLILDSMDNEPIKYAFVIKNLKSRERASFNEDAVVSSASLIKIPVMMEIMRQVKCKKLSLSDRISIDKKVKVPFSILTMLNGVESYSLDDIMTLMIVQSDNTAANILIDIAGMENVNSYMKSLGLKNTILQRKMMDFNARVEGRENYTTAGDMAALLEMLYNGQAVDAQSSTHMLDILKKQLDTGSMMYGLPYETTVAHKTGELECLEHDAGIVYLKDWDYIFCMLTWDASDNNTARKAIGKVSQIAYDYFVQQYRSA